MAQKYRGKNEGSISKRPNGSWRAQVYLKGDRLSKDLPTKADALAWLRETRNKLDQGMNFGGAQSSLSDFLDGWFVMIETSLRPRTVEQYKSIGRLHINPALGRIRLIDLNPEHIQRLYQSKIKAGVGHRTVEMIHVTLHRALDHAVKLGLIGRNPTDATTPVRPEAKETMIYDESQVNQFLITVEGDRLEPIYHLAIATGMRQSELLGLLWSDLDWQRRTITVQRQLKRGGKKGDYFTPPKTRSGRRSILLGSKTIEKLREHYNQQLFERRKMGDRWQENNLIFPSSVGTPLDQYNLYHHFKSTIQRAGLPDIRFHDLRHTAASLMLNHGIPVIIVSRRLGHSKVSITLDIYGHLIQEMQNEAAELIDELMNPIKVELIAPQLHHPAEMSEIPAY